MAWGSLLQPEVAIPGQQMVQHTTRNKFNPRKKKKERKKKKKTLVVLVFQILFLVIATRLAYRHKSSPTLGSQASSCVFKNANLI